MGTCDVQGCDHLITWEETAASGMREWGPRLGPPCLRPVLPQPHRLDVSHRYHGAFTGLPAVRSWSAHAGLPAGLAFSTGDACVTRCSVFPEGRSGPGQRTAHPCWPGQVRRGPWGPKSPSSSHPHGASGSRGHVATLSEAPGHQQGCDPRTASPRRCTELQRDVTSPPRPGPCAAPHPATVPQLVP